MPNVLRDTIIGNWINILGNWLLINICPSILGVFRDNPFYFGFYIFLLINIVLFIHAYIVSGPPRGLKLIDRKIDSTVRIVVKK